eukprot:1159420-Pelagomonas_calceolata.AAC.11
MSVMARPRSHTKVHQCHVLWLSSPFPLKPWLTRERHGTTSQICSSLGLCPNAAKVQQQQQQQHRKLMAAGHAAEKTIRAEGEHSRGQLQVWPWFFHSTKASNPKSITRQDKHVDAVTAATKGVRSCRP